ncbi:sugar transferase [Calderihabitans maritimus]|uniref:UDP-phosphate galactose phosphotransferase n=1 Tax=Calderihabitans maritimus TaxID=1246530 RepID=A0A1Z5HVC4_9FIRM|nr:sugar transferase [Calderihabitans maritimus]GAW93297.1 UDP-phosphate galactose phosphotransferase [Calderihabitans maritimus]
MAITKSQRLCKRIMDLLGSLALLVLFAPLMLLIAVAIKITSPGEVIYRQPRIGQDGKIFTLYKFRTMIPGADTMGSGMFVERNDPRITPVGKFLRKSSLDELPQLFNVLKGEMSLVGPRPAPLHHLGRYDSRQVRRLSVKPGITGWSQVNGRNRLLWPERIEMDLWYIDHYSLWLDIKILFLTVLRLFSGKDVEGRPDRREKDPFMKV